jgi:hypothetical protein
MRGYLDALNAAEGDEPGANAAKWVGEVIEAENNSSGDDGSVISDILFEEN